MKFFSNLRELFHFVVAQVTLREFDLLTCVANLKRVFNNRPITHSILLMIGEPNAEHFLTGFLVSASKLFEKFLKTDTFKTAIEEV